MHERRHPLADPSLSKAPGNIAAAILTQIPQSREFRTNPGRWII